MDLNFLARMEQACLKTITRWANNTWNSTLNKLRTMAKSSLNHNPTNLAVKIHKLNFNNIFQLLVAKGKIFQEEFLGKTRWSPSSISVRLNLQKIAQSKELDKMIWFTKSNKLISNNNRNNLKVYSKIIIKLWLEFQKLNYRLKDSLRKGSWSKAIWLRASITNIKLTKTWELQSKLQCSSRMRKLDS